MYVFCKQKSCQVCLFSMNCQSFVTSMLMNDILLFIETFMIGIHQNRNSDNHMNV